MRVGNEGTLLIVHASSLAYPLGNPGLETQSPTTWQPPVLERSSLRARRLSTATLLPFGLTAGCGADLVPLARGARGDRPAEEDASAPSAAEC
eukprot:4221097-Prymnesium_polylepis.1